MDALRTVVKTSFAIPDSHPIPEVGDDPPRFQASLLPLAILEPEGRAAIRTGNDHLAGGARNVVTTWSVHCWLVNAKTPGSADLETLRTALATLGAALLGDRTIGGTLTTLDITGMDWTGMGRYWPFEVEVAQGVQCGFLSVQLAIVETL